jgi:enoyl-CoA hydratase
LLRERIGRQGAAATALMGETIDGHAAERLGLAWRCTPDDELVEAAYALARRVAGRDAELVRRTKASLNASSETASHRDAIALELDAQRWSMARPGFRDRLVQLRDALSRPREARR